MARVSLRHRLLLGASLTLLLGLGACGGGSGAVNSTPPPPVITPPPPAPPPPPPPPLPPPPPVIPPVGSFDTAEYRGSPTLVQAQAISAYDAGANAGGLGVIAAVVDSGVDPANPEFAGRIHPNSRDISGSRGLGDQGNHGSQVAGVLLGARNGSASHGVAFNATLLALRTDTEGSCEAPNPTVQGGCFHAFINIARAIDVARTTGARVVNLSIVGDAPASELLGAIDRATAAGVIIVISAGNGRTLDPAAFAQVANRPEARGLVIVAGALDATNAALTNFSARAGNSASHFLSALGLSVRTVNAAGAPSVVSGTSFSAPVIAGAVALLAQTFPNLSSAQIVDILFRTANDLGNAGVDTQFGNGALNLARAFSPQGRTLLAGVGLPLPLGTSLGTASTAVGDGGRGAGTTIVLDSYGRAFDVSLDQAIGVARPVSLLAGLAGQPQHEVGASLGATQIALSVTQSSRGAVAAALNLSPDDRETAQLLAGSVVTRFGSRTLASAGFRVAGGRLLSAMIGQGSPSFLAAGHAGDGLRSYQRPGSSYAIAHRFGQTWLTASLDSGAMWTPDFARARSLRPVQKDDRYDQMSLGISHEGDRLTLGGQVSTVREQGTILGARFSPLIGNGAQSWFADLSARVSPLAGWQLGASWRGGLTRTAVAGVRQSADTIRSNAWSFDVTRDQLLASSDSLSLRLAQPLRVTRGGLTLNLPTSYDYATGSATFGSSRLNLAPRGRELDLEAAYNLRLATASLGANLFWRREPGNLEAAPDDVGGAVRFSFAF